MLKKTIKTSAYKVSEDNADIITTRCCICGKEILNTEDRVEYLGKCYCQECSPIIP